MKTITAATLIPIGSLGVLIGGVYWFTSMYNQVQANTKTLEKREAKDEQYVKDIGEIKGAIIEIKADIKYLRKK